MTAGPESAAVFRAGLPADEPAIRAILLDSNLSLPAIGSLERVTHSQIGEIRTFVCEQNNHIAGVLQWRNLGEEAEVLDLAVHPRHRRRGLASFLLSNFLRQLSPSAVQKIFLEVRESNAAAISLYEKFGFQISGGRPNYYRNPEESALLMTLSLEA